MPLTTRKAGVLIASCYILIVLLSFTFFITISYGNDSPIRAKRKIDNIVRDQKKQETITRRDLLNLKNMLEDSVSESWRFTSFVIAAIGVIFTLVNLLLGILVSWYFRKSQQMADFAESTKTEMDLLLSRFETIKIDNENIEKRKADIHDELARMAEKQHIALAEEIGKLPDPAPEQLIPILELYHHFDRYRSALVTCLSRNKNTRFKAYQTIATEIGDIDSAKSILLLLLKYMEGPQFVEDKGLIITALGGHP